MIRGLVIVHGAGKQSRQYHIGGLMGLTELVGTPVPHIQCWYAHLSNTGPRTFDIESVANDQIDTQNNQLQQVFARFYQRLKVNTSAIADPVLDVIHYATRRQIRNHLQAILMAKLTAAQSAFDETVVVSHSLGTAIAFDVLRKHASVLNVRYLVTLGSPLQKLWRLKYCPSDTGDIKLGTIRRWLNFYDRHDLVADPLAATFPKFPIEDIEVFISNHFIEAHEYWTRRVVQSRIATLLTEHL